MRRREVLKAGCAALTFAGSSIATATTARDARPTPGGALEIDATGRTTPISPMIFGQFIEFLGRSITGGVFDEGSDLSDPNGFRTDVMAKIQHLRPSVLRFPGGTVTKIYHWQDGVGPLAQRKARPNLIWGGVETNRFGTDEFIRYARQVKAEPFLTVSMSVGAAEEAANWVEYCNGAGGTYYADQRRRNGFEAPHAVKYWGLGNEEDAEPDAGRLQDAGEYAKEAWYYTKLMKLTDPSIKLIAAGGGREWNMRVIRDLNPAIDYISSHIYLKTSEGLPQSLIASADNAETTIATLRAQINDLAPGQVTGFNRWYRFPPRQAPMKIALDEIGIWEDAGAGAYNMEVTYNWNHALATATLYNILIRNADVVGMATWAQTVNVLAPIMSDAKGSIRQTIYFVMDLYRRFCGARQIAVELPSPVLNLPGAEARPCLDAACTLDDATGALTVFVVNRHPARAVRARFSPPRGYLHLDVVELTAPSPDSANALARPSANVVVETSKTLASTPNDYLFTEHSVTVLRFRK
jgi:alpha-L-arabinofuranosidase